MTHIEFIKKNEHSCKYVPDTLTASIIDVDGGYAICWPAFYYDDDGYVFKTLNGAIRRLERNGFVMA